VLSRVRRFLSVPDDDKAVGVRPSDLTREHLREVLRMFIATQPGAYAVPFNRLSTGALNVLVFALPPHTQRRMVEVVLAEMGCVVEGIERPDCMVVFVSL
jgi:putative ATP-dependent endonuclease of the OLD family